MTEKSQKFEVHPTIVTRWKVQFLESAPTVFADKKRKSNGNDICVDDLYKQIGVLQVERDFLRKKYKQVFGTEPI